MAKKMLGLSFSARSIYVAEVSMEGKTFELAKTAEFEWDAQAKKPATTATAPADDNSKKFAAFLKQNGFTARAACMGLPTQWLMLKEKSLPAVSSENLAGLLVLQAERDFSLEPKDIILDYCAVQKSWGKEGEQGLSVLLAAALRDRVEQCAAIATGAGLSVKYLSSSALQVAKAAEAADANVMIFVGPHGADLIVRTGAGLYVPGVLSSSPKPENALNWPTGIGMEARRILGLRAGLGTDIAGQTDGLVSVFNAAELDTNALKALKNALGRETRVTSEFPALKAISSAPRFAPAAALAARGLSELTPDLNFLDSKLVEKTQGAFEKVKLWMWVAAVLVLGVLVALAWTWISDSQEYASLKKQADTRKAEVDSAKQFLARYASAEGWYDKRPNILDCMKALTKVLPTSGNAWIANLSMKEDFRCVVSMKAVDTKTYFDVFDAIEKDDDFREVKLVYMTQPDKKKSEISFAVSFVYWKQ